MGIYRQPWLLLVIFLATGPVWGEGRCNNLLRTTLVTASEFRSFLNYASDKYIELLASEVMLSPSFKGPPLSITAEDQRMAVELPAVEFLKLMVDSPDKFDAISYYARPVQPEIIHLLLKNATGADLHSIVWRALGPDHAKQVIDAEGFRLLAKEILNSFTRNDFALRREIAFYINSASLKLRE